MRKSLIAAVAASLVLGFVGHLALAGTTGGVHGRVLDVETGAEVAGAKVTASSPSQTETVYTNGDGYYSFISLDPDTYTLTATKDGYEVTQSFGVTIVADQNHAVDIRPHKVTKTLATVRVMPTVALVRAGQTSDVYSINAAAQKATIGLGGSGSFDQAYGAISSAPGVVYQGGQQGWYQNVYIRGGDLDQVAFEVDGVPMMRVSDSATMGTLSNLGQAEVQVYTGGTPASAEASGLAGYVNQVIRTGSYPGFTDLTLGVGYPTLYNKAQLEVGGASPDRGFSYYVGGSMIAQAFRYGNQNNEAGNPLFFFPMFIPSNNGLVFDGTGTPFFAPGQTYEQAYNTDSESIVNLHFAIPHRRNSSRDDVQFLYTYSNVTQNFYSSINDLGLNDPTACSDVGFTFLGGLCQIPFFDQAAYNGAVFAPPDPSKVSIMLFPNEGKDRTPGALIPPAQREGSQNGNGLEKLQYQFNFDSKTYLRLFAYGIYGWWFISGPVSAQLTFGDQLPDYEVITHQYGTTADFSRELSEKHLITLSASYLTAKMQTYSMGFQTGQMTSYIDAAGNCYNGDPLNPGANGEFWSCFDPGSGGFATFGPPLQVNLTPAFGPPGSPAANNNAQWIVTENGQNAQVDNVMPYFTGLSLSDSWRPNDKLTVQAGVRLENFVYKLQDLTTGYPARPFWFKAFNRENCFTTGLLAPVDVFPDPATGTVTCPPGTTNTDLVNFAGGFSREAIWEPRLGFTLRMSPDTVIRGSYGRYARPEPTSYKEYNTFQQNLPSFISSFLSSGYNSPFQPLKSDTSNNFDLSLEHHIANTDMSFKLTPFYRNTQNQLQYTSLNAQGVVAGVNVGQQRSYGVEFAFDKGSFTRDGFAFQLGVTLTNSQVRYGDLPNGLNVIDLLNYYIKQYNSYTSACGSPSADANLCGKAIWGTANAFPCFFPSPDGVMPGLPDSACSSGSPANPYFNSAPQPLLDRNGWYTTYDQLPAPFNNALAFATPFQATAVLNYKHDRFSFTPTLTYSSQSFYGSPLVWPGYVPQTCLGVVGGVGNMADTTTCSPVETTFFDAMHPEEFGQIFFIPDKYTGKFDNLGDLREPSRITLGIATSYDISDHITATLTLANLVDHCFQRGYPWDNGSTCVYAQLASNLLAPAGNFVANPPPQLAFPYGSWYNNIEIGQSGQQSPMAAALELQFKL